MAHLCPELRVVGAVYPRAVTSREREGRVEGRAGHVHGVLRTLEPQLLGPDVGSVFGGVGVDRIGVAEVVERFERHAVEHRLDDVESGGAFAVERLAQVEQRQLQVVARLGERHAVVGRKRLALVDGRFGLFAGGGQFAAAECLLRAQLQLAFGYADHLLAVEHLQVERHDVDRHILADPFEILDGGGQVQFPGLDLVVDPHALEQGHRCGDVERSRGLVVVAVGVVAGQGASKGGVAADRGIQVGQTAVAGRGELDVAPFDLQLPLLHLGVVLLGVGDALGQRPRSSRGGSCRGCGRRIGLLCAERQGGEPDGGACRDDAGFHGRIGVAVIWYRCGRRGPGRRP